MPRSTRATLSLTGAQGKAQLCLRFVACSVLRMKSLFRRTRRPDKGRVLAAIRRVARLGLLPPLSSAGRLQANSQTLTTRRARPLD